MTRHSTKRIGRQKTKVSDPSDSLAARLGQSKTARKRYHIMPDVTRSPQPTNTTAADKRPCDHVWEYTSGPDHAANFLCSRCEAEMVAPVKQAQAR